MISISSTMSFNPAKKKKYYKIISISRFVKWENWSLERRGKRAKLHNGSGIYKQTSQTLTPETWAFSPWDNAAGEVLFIDTKWHSRCRFVCTIIMMVYRRRSRES